jgi:hypothetical protein
MVWRFRLFEIAVCRAVVVQDCKSHCPNKSDKACQQRSNYQVLCHGLSPFYSDLSGQCVRTNCYELISKACANM